MRPRIPQFLKSLCSTPNSKVLAIKYNLSHDCDFTLLRKVKHSNCQSIKTAIRSILHERGYTPAEISVLIN